jgi:uncharacterized protein YjiS (DUF1127 family)
MSAATSPIMTKSQLGAARPGRDLLRSLRWAVATLRLWRQRARERRVLAALNERELADFGASTADVYRELNTPIWHSLPPF